MEFLKYKGSDEARGKGLVAFSFDDGPNPQNAVKVLEILNNQGVQGTYFWIVENARRLKGQDKGLYASVLGLISDGGHEIGLHAPYDYKPSLLTRVYGKFSAAEMTGARDELEDLIETPVTFYRPHILLQPATINFARQIGLTTVLGDVTRAYADAAAGVEEQVTRFSSAQAGSILLFHDGISLNRQLTHITDVLPRVILNIRENGLTPTNVSGVL